MIYAKLLTSIYNQFIEHGFENNLKKKVVNDLLNTGTYENDDILEKEDIEEMCLVAAKIQLLSSDIIQSV